MKQIVLLSFSLAVVLMACNGDKNNSSTESTESKPETGGTETNAMEKVSRGKIVYETNCKLCHGADGALGSGGAASLKTSTLNEADAITVVTYGKGAMMSYKDILSKQEVENVVAYIETLRK